jgi:hypothetical protein
MSFMYGMLLPILFPIALFAFGNLYVNERILLAYYYQKPPIYDDELIKCSISMMKGAPVLMLLMGYWALGNR